jgi:hypothetical protein
VSAVWPGFVFLCGCSFGGRRRRFDEDASKVRSCAGSSDISAGFPVFAGVGGERSRCFGGAWLVEEARSPSNKLLLAVFHLDVMRSGVDARPVGLRLRS